LPADLELPSSSIVDPGSIDSAFNRNRIDWLVTIDDELCPRSKE